MLKLGKKRLIAFSTSVMLVILAFAAINVVAGTNYSTNTSDSFGTSFDSNQALLWDPAFSLLYYMPVQLSTPAALQTPHSLSVDSNGVLRWTADPAANQHQVEVQVNSAHWHTTPWSSLSTSNSQVWFDLRTLNIPHGNSVRVRVVSRETTGLQRLSSNSSWLDVSHWHGWNNWQFTASGSNVRSTINAVSGQNISGIDLINVSINPWQGWGGYWDQNWWGSWGNWGNASIEFRWRHEGSSRWYTGNRTSINWNTGASWTSWTAVARLPITDVRAANAGYYRLYVYSNVGGSWQRMSGPVGSRVRLNVDTGRWYDGRWWDDRWYWDPWYRDSWYWDRNRSWRAPAFTSPRSVPASPAAVGGDGGAARVTTPAAQQTQEQPIYEPAAVYVPPEVPMYNPFVDVSAADWFYNYVRLAYRNHFMVGTGTEPMTFSPHAPLTRAMIVTILFNMDQPTMVDTNNPFSDVQLGSWYATPVIWAASNGIISGFGDGRFGPNENVTMQDLTVILNNYARTRGWLIPPVHNFMNRDLGANAARYAQEAISRFAMAGVIDGNLGNVFHPTRHATRAETAAMLIRFEGAWTY